MKSDNRLYVAAFLALLLLAVFLKSFVIVNAGERGVVMKFGRVQERVLEEGLHPIVQWH
jgi:regulator of protease activity HflC (stomatin/prohibitin superfamily)